MKAERMEQFKKLMIWFWIYVNIAVVLILHSKVNHLESVIVTLLNEKAIPIEQQQRIMDYFENHDGMEDSIWLIPEDDFSL